MNLRQMEYLLAIVETKNISRAAEQCYISQSGMSQQLASVEKELGMSMFQRINNELVPTREGEIYIRYTREILGLHARALREMEDCANPDRGRILIGVGPERGNAMIQQIFPGFRKKFPNVQIQIVENHLYEMEQMICNNMLDLAEAAYMPQIPNSISTDVKAVDLYTERIMLVMPNTPYYQKKLQRLGLEQEKSVADLVDFQEEGFVIPSETRIRLRRLVDKTFQDAGFVPKIMLETSNNASAINFVAGGNYLSLVPQSYYYGVYGQTDRLIYRMVRQNPYWNRALIYRKNARLTEAEKCLIRMIRGFHSAMKETLDQDNQSGPLIQENK